MLKVNRIHVLMRFIDIDPGRIATICSCAFCVTAFAILQPVFAAEDFSWTITPGTTRGFYAGSLYRDYFTATSVDVEGHRANHWGFAAGLDRTDIHYRFGIPTYQQDALYIFGYASDAPRNTLGTYTSRLDYHCVSDRNGNYSADDVCVIAPMIAYLQYDNSFYFDIGYALSDYGTSSTITTSLRVEQWTPTLGFALNSSATHWLQLRGYFIHFNNPVRALQKTQTNAYEVKYLYYPLSAYRVIPVYLEASVLAGERIYAVDRDTRSVSNLEELEKGALTFSAQWRLSKIFGLMISATRTRYTEQTASGDNNYVLNSTWLGLITHW